VERRPVRRTSGC